MQTVDDLTKQADDAAARDGTIEYGDLWKDITGEENGEPPDLSFAFWAKELAVNVRHKAHAAQAAVFYDRLHNPKRSKEMSAQSIEALRMMNAIIDFFGDKIVAEAQLALSGFLDDEKKARTRNRIIDVANH